MNKICLYSITFGKRVSKWYNINVLSEVLSFSDENELFKNTISFLVNLSNYETHLNESLTYEMK